VQVYMIIHADHSATPFLPMITTAPEFKASPQIRQLLCEGGKDRGTEGQARQRSTRRDGARGCCKNVYTYVCICIHTALCILRYTDKYPQTITYRTHSCIHHKSRACLDSQKETECSFIHVLCGLQTVPCPTIPNVETLFLVAHFFIAYTAKSDPSFILWS
jgi:hypothetical protein